MDNETRDDMKKEIRGWAIAIGFALLLSVFVTNFIIINAHVPSGSMENTIMTNDRVVAFRLSYLTSEPQRFDIIVFPAPDDPQTLNVKRIIGLPGETLEILDGYIYIGDATFEDQQRLDDSAFVRDQLQSGQFAGPYHIPEGAFFVMGDNRNHSRDSRDWADTFVRRENILGRVIFKYHRGFAIF